MTPLHIIDLIKEYSHEIEEQAFTGDRLACEVSHHFSLWAQPNARPDAQAQVVKKLEEWLIREGKIEK
jgi:hypothetical protein